MHQAIINSAVATVILTTFLFGRYLAELLAERQKLAPFVQVLPFCTRLLNQGLFPLPPGIISVASCITFCYFNYFVG